MHKMTGRPADDTQSILSNVYEIACDFASQRSGLVKSSAAVHTPGIPLTDFGLRM